MGIIVFIAGSFLFLIIIALTYDKTVTPVFNYLKKYEKEGTSSYNGLHVLSVLMIFYSLFILTVPLVHMISNGFNTQCIPIFGIGISILLLAVGLLIYNYWVWLMSVLFFSMIALLNIFSYIKTRDPKIIGNETIIIVVLIILNKYRYLVVRHPLRKEMTNI